MQQPLLITANAARAEQAVQQLRSAQEEQQRPVTPFQSCSTGPQVVLLVDSSSPSPRARSHMGTDHVRVVDEAGLAELLDLTDSKLVMDGVVW
jgi:hypothetical protein